MQILIAFFSLSSSAAVLSGLQGECGEHGQVNFGSCDNRNLGMYPCCSRYGYCGGNEQYCGAGCIAEYSLNGKCEIPISVPPSTLDAAECEYRIQEFNERLQQCYVASHRDECPCDLIDALKFAIRPCGLNDVGLVKANDLVIKACNVTVI